ncbi:MAG TPA: ABC transporter permease [Candidatus Thermoplasmatota archaeon]|nr:ABC transporter permease [Candidatus Thermoplasmatota archaeon]
MALLGFVDEGRSGNGRSDMSAASWGRVIRAGVKKNWVLSVTYPSWVLNRIFGPIVWVGISVFSYTALVPASDVRDAFVRSGQGPDFVTFLILGQTIFSLFTNLNWRGGMAIQRERWQGTLEIIMLAPTSRVAYILGESLFGLIDGGWTVLLALVVTGIAFGAGFHVADPALALAVLALTLSAMVALSLFFAAFYVLTRSAGPLSFAIQTPVRFFTGTNFPVSALPVLLQTVSYALPMTYGMIAVRQVFTGAGTWASLSPTLLALTGFTVFFWTLGVILIRRMETLAKERGTLHHY